VFTARAVYVALFGRATKAGLEQGLAAYYHVYAMPKKFVPQSRTPRSRREVKPPQQPHIVSFRLSPSEFEKLESHVEAIGINRSDFVRRAVMSMARGEMKFTEVMPMAVTGIERDVFELRKALAQQAELIKILAAASVGTAALLMNKEGSTLADNQRRVDKAIDLAITAAPQIIGRCLQLNPGLGGSGNS
jgi:Arc/MetJ-type ribon-helix-helix transcriptional regulator